jgi:trypsin
MRRSTFVLLATVAALSTSCSGPTASRASSSPSSAPPSITASSQSATVTAVPVRPDPRIGAIFLGGRDLHTCTGSVLHSVTGDLILTAAHCLAGGVDTSFVPAFVGSAQSQQFWTVDAVYLDPRWVSVQDPLADFAVARVSRAGGDRVESEAGGGFTLGSSPAVGTDVAVTGYGFGAGGGPIGCTARTSARERGYPALQCAGLVDGTSGSPWLAGTTVVGITGGLEGGGCQENVSYAPPFDGAVERLLLRAEAGGPGDDAPAAFGVDC